MRSPTRRLARTSPPAPGAPRWSTSSPVSGQRWRSFPTSGRRARCVFSRRSTRPPRRWVIASAVGRAASSRRSWRRALRSPSSVPSARPDPRSAACRAPSRTRVSPHSRSRRRSCQQHRSQRRSRRWRRSQRRYSNACLRRERRQAAAGDQAGASQTRPAAGTIARARHRRGTSLGLAFEDGVTAERSPWPMVLAGVALMVAALLMRWILAPRAP